MKEIKLTQGKVALVDDDDFEYLNQFKWCAHRKETTYYAVRSVTISPKKRIMVKMHRVIIDAGIGIEVDHIDRNGLNNQKVNLRLCTGQQNRINRGAHRNNKSGFKGVSWNKKDKRWRACISKDKKHFCVGSFSTPQEAAKAYDKAATKMFGEFAVLNY